MSEAELRIRPTLVGNYRSELRAASSEARRLEQRHRSTTRQGIREASQLERAWTGVGRSLRGTTTGLGSVTRSLTSVQSIVMGVAGGMAGRTLFDLMIGSNAQLENAQITFNAMIGDADKAQKLINDIREQARTTPFAQSDLIEGSRRLLRLTGDNVSKNKELLNLALNMSSVAGKPVVDAAEAILDAEMGEFERLKEFGIKLKKSSVTKGKEAGESFGEAALRGVQESLSAQTGGADLVGAKSTSFTGRLSTVQDMIRNVFQKTGKAAFMEFSTALGDVQEDLDKVLSSDEFEAMMSDVSGHAKNFAKWISEGIRKLPSLIDKSRQFFSDAKEFWDDNKGLIMALGGGLALNKITGGGLGRGLDSAGQRLLFGRGGGGGPAGALGALASGPGGAVPVYIVGGGGMGGGVGDAMMRARGARAGLAGAPLTTGGLLKSGGLTAASGSVGAGGALGMAVIPASFAFAAKTFYDVVEDTSDIVKRFDDRATMASNAKNEGVLQVLNKERDARGMEYNRVTDRTGLLSQMLADGNVEGAKAEVVRILGGSGDRFDGGDADSQALSDINAALGSYGLQANIKKGRRNSAIRFKGGVQTFSGDTKARYDELMALRNTPEISDAVLAARSGDPSKLKALGISPDDINRLGGELIDMEETASRGAGMVGALNRAQVGKVEVNNYFTGPMDDKAFRAAQEQSVNDARSMLERALSRDAKVAQD